MALKVVHAASLNDPAARERFRRKARLIARLEHPHILPIYNFDGHSAPRYLVMRYLNQGTLRDLLENRGLPPTTEHRRPTTDDRRRLAVVGR